MSEATQPAVTKSQPPGAAERALERLVEEDDLGQVYDLRMLRRLWPLIGRERRLLVGSLLLLLVISALAIVRPLIMREALRDVQQAGGSASITVRLFSAVSSSLSSCSSFRRPIGCRRRVRVRWLA